MDTSTTSPTSKGTPFGTYQVFEALGSGGMATVHRAARTLDDGGTEVVALKRLHPDLQHDIEALKAFEQEAELAALLNHPGIVRSVEHGHVDGQAYLSMEYIEGYELRHVLKQARRVLGPPPPRVTLSILMQLLKALDYAHQKRDPRGESLQLVHRDISPSNLILTFEGKLKIIDFGIAKAMRDRAEEAVGVVKGKLPYMSPEALAGRALDARADIWSVGVIAHELCCARALFACPTDYETAKRVRSGKIPACSTVNPKCPKDLDAVIAQALRRIPASRWQSASAMLDALQAVAERHGLDTNRSAVSSWLQEAFKDGVIEEHHKEKKSGKSLLRRLNRATAPMGNVHAPGPSASIGPSDTLRDQVFVDEDSRAGHLADLPNGEQEIQSANLDSLREYSKALEAKIEDNKRRSRRAREALDKPMVENLDAPTLVRYPVARPPSAEPSRSSATVLDKPPGEGYEAAPPRRPATPRPFSAPPSNRITMPVEPLPTLREPTIELDAEPVISYRDTGVTGPSLHAGLQQQAHTRQTPIPLRAPRPSSKPPRPNTVTPPMHWPHGTLAPPPPQGGDRLVQEAKMVQAAQLRAPRAQSYDHRETIRERHSGVLPLVIAGLGIAALTVVGVYRMGSDDAAKELDEPAAISPASAAHAVDEDEMVRTSGDELEPSLRSAFDDAGATALICVDSKGRVQSARVNGSLDGAQRLRIESTLSEWHFEPVLVDDEATPACFVMH